MVFDMDLGDINARISELIERIAKDQHEVMQLYQRKQAKEKAMKRMMDILQQYEDKEKEEGLCELVQCPNGCDYHVCVDCIKKNGKKYTHYGDCKAVITV